MAWYSVGDLIESGVEWAAEELGASEAVAETLGDIVGIGTDIALGNYYGALDNAVDLAEDASYFTSESGSVAGMPQGDDTIAWRQWAETAGWEAVKQAIIDGRIPESVLKDPGFQLAVQDAKAGYEARYALLSGISKSENDVRMNIIRNTFA